MSGIVIISGEGEQGTVEQYQGETSDRAIKARLTKERKDGRWAKAYVYSHDSDDGPVYANFEEPSDLRHINP